MSDPSISSDTATTNPTRTPNPSILPFRLWSTAYLMAHPDLLAEATTINPERVAELFEAASQPVALPHSTPRSRARIPDPTPYDGSVEKLYPFIDSLTNKLAVDGHIFHGEDAKIGYGYACLSPSAKERLAVEFAHLRNPELSPKISTFPKFIDTLKRYFDDPGRTLKADQKITTMRQGNRPFTTFLAEWDTTLAHSTYATAPDATKTSLLRNTLCIELHEQFVGRTLPPTYEGLVDLCKSLDADLQQVASYRRNLTVRSQTTSRPTPFRTPVLSPAFQTSYPVRHPEPLIQHAQATTPLPDQRTVSQGGNLMDLDSASKEKGPEGRLTQNAKDARRRLNRCLRCNQPGHVAINCPLGQRLRATETPRCSVLADEQLKE